MAPKIDWTRLRDLFDRTANLDAVERARLLDRECGDDPDLRRQVEEMLAAHDAAGGFLTAPTEPRVAPHMLTRGATDPMPGTIIGPYKLLQQIGEGGFGVVYMAEQQEPIVRRVALKVIKLGMDTKQVIARFEAERQALALMDHPNIARIFDAGATKAGRPYFVMELVHGIPITEYCDREVLTTRQRLELFIPVCQAVAHAHQKGVIHRDLKPNNVLVTLHDGVPVPKVIDFGIARAIHQRLTERTLFTEYGQLIGTPEYMSPEQAEMSGLDIDTRSDIYSLGALLYELLTGESLFDPKLLRSLALREIQRVLRDEEPPRPSARVSSLGVTATEVAHHRGVEATQLVRLLRGDPDWIVVKAIAKDRRHRYGSAGALAEDIERSLRSEPVTAGPPRRLYRLRKFVKRHRGPVAAALVVMAAVVSFGSLALWQGQRAMTEGLKARANAILAAAAAAKDPLVKALLVRELEGLPGLGAGELSKAQSVLGAPLPVAVFGETHPNVGGAVQVATSPDGSRVVIGSQDGTLRVWRADGTGEPVVLSGHALRASTPGAGAHSVNYVGFSPDGSRVITCSWDRTARVWPAVGGEPVVLRGHEDLVLWAAWSPDGTSLVTASADGTARIWPADGIGKSVVIQVGDVLRVSFSPDGASVVTASVDGTVRVWRADGRGAPIVLKGHERRVTSASFSPNGRSILTASDDGTARVWRANGIGTPVILRGHEGRVTSANFSPDGRHIVTASSDRTARVWRADGTGEPAILAAHSDGLGWAGFGPDGSRVFTRSEDGTARVWEPFAPLPGFGNVMQTLPAEGYRGRTVRFRAKVRVEANEGSGRAQLWLRVDCRTGVGFFDNMQSRPITSSQWREFEIVGDVAEDALSINLGMILSGAGRAWMDAASLEIVDGQVPGGQGLVDPGFEAKPPRGWGWSPRAGTMGYRGQMVEENPAEGQRCVRLEVDETPSYRSRVLASHGRGIRVVSLDARGNSLVTASDDGSVRVWRTGGTGEPVVLRGHEGGIRGFSTELYRAAFSPDGQRVVTASSDGTARVWRTDGTGAPIVFRGHMSPVIRATFSPDGQRILTASNDGTARVWRADGTGVPIVLGHSGWVRSPEFSPDGQRIVTASYDSTVRVWHTDGAGEPVLLRGHEGPVLGAGFSPDGQRIVTASEDSTARVWRADGTGEPVVLSGHDGRVSSAAFSGNGRRIVTASDDGCVRVWRADGTGEPVVLRGGDGTVTSAAFSPNGRLIVTASTEDGGARVWHADGTGEPLLLEGHQGGVTTAAFSPDGQRVVTASKDGTARVWRADGTGEPILLKGHESFVLSAAFSPDGERVVTTSADGTARLWRVTWEGLFEYLNSNVALCLMPEQRMQYLGESRSEAWHRYADCERQHGRTPKPPDAK